MNRVALVAGMASGLVLGLGGAALAADLEAPVAVNQCIVSPMSTVMSLPRPQLHERLQQDYALAKAESTAPDTIASTSPRFTWALEAKLQCSIALGYMRTGAIDAESSRKCDCFTQHMASFP